MKKSLFTMIALAGMLGSTLFAALPPLAQNAREIDAILVSQELYQKLDVSGQIKLIKRIRENTYLVVTNKQKIKVDVIYGAGAQNNASVQGGVGPQQFKLVFHDAVSAGDDEDFD